MSNIFRHVIPTTPEHAWDILNSWAIGAEKFTIDQCRVVMNLLVGEEFNYRHPKAQALIGAKARREIELGLIETLVDHGGRYEGFGPTDHDYWTELVDKVQLVLRKYHDQVKLYENALNTIADNADDRFTVKATAISALEDGIHAGPQFLQEDEDE